MIYHLTQGEEFIYQTRPSSSGSVSPYLVKAAMSGDEDAAVLDGVVAADETQAQGFRGLVYTWKWLEGTFQSQLKEQVMDS